MVTHINQWDATNAMPTGAVGDGHLSPAKDSMG